MTTSDASDRNELIKQVSAGFEAAKGGEAIATYNRFLPLFADGTLPLKSHYAFGWITYYALHQSAATDIDGRKHMLATYLKLSTPRPHKLHSMILGEAVRLAKDAAEQAPAKKGKPRFSFLRFVELWDVANLRPGDWRRKEIDGKQLSCLAEKAITLFASEAADASEHLAEPLVKVIDEALSKFPDSYHLMSQRAAIHLLEGETEQAAKLLREALIEAPGKFYLWSRLASTVSIEENPRLRIALLYKALTAPGPDQFKGKVRLELARTLIARGAFAQALYELELVRSAYEANGWHLSPTFVSLSKQIPAGTEATNPAEAYRAVAPMADEYVYASLPPVEVTKTFHKKPQPEGGRQAYGRPMVAWRVTDSEGNSLWFKPERMRIDPNLPMGTPLIVRIHAGKIVHASLPQ